MVGTFFALDALLQVVPFGRRVSWYGGRKDTRKKRVSSNFVCTGCIAAGSAAGGAGCRRIAGGSDLMARLI